jgi:hypothetical protein
MTSRERRDELRVEYERQPRTAGVYAIRNTVTGRVLIASSTDLASVHNRLEFGRSTGSTGVLDRRLVEDARRHGMDAFEIEVLDTLDADSSRSEEDTRADLRTLEELWRETLGIREGD